MYAGQVVESAEVAELFRRPAHPYTVGLFDSLAAGAAGVLQPIPGVVPQPGQPAAGVRLPGALFPPA